MSDTLLSIIVITYNQEQYIKQTIESIINQKTEYKYELLIGDDCSKDSTREILNDYAQKYPDIIKPIYNEKNLGAVGNYFNVLKHCSGKYIMECGGDDWWFPEKLVKQISYMESNPNTGMCYGKAKCYDENGNSLNYEVGNSINSLEELLSINQIPACSVCFRKELADKYIIDISPENKMWRMEDYPMWIWMMKNSNIHFIDDYLAAYRIITDSVSRSSNIEKQISFEENTWEIRKFFAEKYGINIKTFDREQYRNELLYSKLLKKYDPQTASELKKTIKCNSIKNIFKYMILSSRLLFNVYRFFKNR